VPFSELFVHPEKARACGIHPIASARPVAILNAVYAFIFFLL
jgi:hypothetical protein